MALLLHGLQVFWEEVVLLDCPQCPSQRVEVLRWIMGSQVGLTMVVLARRFCTRLVMQAALNLRQLRGTRLSRCMGRWQLFLTSRVGEVGARTQFSLRWSRLLVLERMWVALVVRPLGPLVRRQLPLPGELRLAAWLVVGALCRCMVGRWTGVWHPAAQGPSWPLAREDPEECR